MSSTSYFTLNGQCTNFSTGFAPHYSSGNINAYDNMRNNGTAISAYDNSNIYPSFNYFCGSVNYDLSAYYGAYILAQNCYYNNGTPRLFRQGGYIDIGGANNCSLLKGNSIAENDLQNEDIQSNGEVPQEFRETNIKYFELSKKVSEDLRTNGKIDQSKYSEEFNEVINGFKDFIDKNPDSDLSNTALVTAAHSFRQLDDFKGMNLFLQEISKNSKLINKKGLAKRLMIDYYIHENDFTNAISIADETIKENANDKNLLCDVVLAKGLIYSHNLDNETAAISAFSDIINNYSDNSLVEFAKSELKLLEVKPEKQAKENSSEESNLEFSTSSYPNPFNPTTVINYTLPVDAKVLIKVYDILGREVIELVNEFKGAGKYSVQFDGSNLSSGVYFYSITADNYHQTKKIVLTK